MIPGGRYPYNGDVSNDADWLHEPTTGLVWKNVLVYEKLDASGAGCQRIVKHKGKDAAIAFPLLEKPGGGTLKEFLAANHARMYLGGVSDNTAYGNSNDKCSIAPAYLPLVYCWALQILSALSEIHRCGIVHMDVVSLDCFWLYENLSIALVGFQSADFINLKGERV